MIRMITCQEARRYVFGYLDGELELATESEFLAHLEACKRCLGVVEFERRVLAFVRRRSRLEPAPEALKDRVGELVDDASPADG